ncbi:MAG: hypothetical protein ACXQS8_03290 [Candidatus Helarchaeales archaeon]
MSTQELNFKLLGGLPKQTLLNRTSAETGIVHGILLRNKKEGLAFFISMISLKPGSRSKSKSEEKPIVIGGFSKEDIKEELRKLKKQKWTPIGHLQIDIGREAVKKYLESGNEFALINIEELFGIEPKKNAPTSSLSYYI